MKITNSVRVLESLGYTIVYEKTPPVEPERVDLRFLDIVPEFSQLESLSWIAGARLYRHQYKAFRALEEGKNVILRSGTGSGKTEAWVLYFLRQARDNKKYRSLAVYPTLALANDQIKRINLYASAVGVDVLQLDAPRRDKYVKSLKLGGLKRRIAGSRLVITNPAFLLHEVKKLILKPSSALLEPFMRNLNLFVIDELDFYGPRSLALLMAMIEILSMYSEVKPQVVILTATLANPEELGRYLEDLTGREYVIVDGKAFHVENRTIIVLGKELDRVWDRIRVYYGELAGREDVDQEILDALRSFKKFKENAYKVIAYLQALGYRAPSIGLDYTEILKNYVGDDGVTLVFTRSIAKAEEVAKRLKSVLGSNADKVASHHHLVPKDLREEIEEKARAGEIKIIVSPRTLTQGIDIGTIVRIVHMGLPEDVREYLQREGRKGRRTHIPFTETIIVPASRWDHELLSKGLNALKKWLSLPLEKTIVNPENLYIKLFTGIAKLVSPWIPSKLDLLEKEVLTHAGVISGGSVKTKKLKWIWERLNFYEFAPPYGIKRYLETSQGIRSLEPIGHCDLVERFQAGCIDYSSDSMVYRLKTGRTARLVTAVIEKPLREINFWENDALAEAYEEYLDIKTRWGEEPSLLRDLMKGKIYSYVYCVVYPPRNGFGILYKIPNRVLWMVSSEKPKVLRIGGKHIVTHDKKAIYVATPVYGEYRDYTYGWVYEVDEREDVTLLRLGLALLMIVLRRIYGIAFETIMYSVERIGGKKYIELHEPEAAGLINTLDWVDVREAVEKYTPDDLDLILLSQIDDLAYSDLLALGLDWNIIKEYTLRVMDYVLRSQSIIVELLEEVRAIPKPSKALRLVVIDALSEDIDRGDVYSIPLRLVSIAVFDGEDMESYTSLRHITPLVKPPEELRRIENKVDDLVYYSEYTLLVPTKSIADTLAHMGLRKLPMLIRDRAIEVLPLADSRGLKNLSMDTLFDLLPQVFPEEADIPRLPRIHKKVVEIKEKGYTSLTDYSRELIERYIRARAKALYLLYLIISSRKT
ncbi:MAG: DEAD/DEAH box helicase [Desulfurococcales archaeon]|nr:DEAD/DEAH box helicase [Desulfurococcales archaeon]